MSGTCQRFSSTLYSGEATSITTNSESSGAMVPRCRPTLNDSMHNEKGPRPVTVEPFFVRCLNALVVDQLDRFRALGDRLFGMAKVARFAVVR